MDLSRINSKWPLAREGLPFVGAACALTALFVYFDLRVLSILGAVFSLFTIYFFRDPQRSPSAPSHAILTPADGKIIRIANIADQEGPLGEPSIMVSIFMSIFNVHVNRIPATGCIEEMVYYPGRFFSANLDKASEKNERNMITLRTLEARKIVFVQIAGLIARRIACWVQKGDDVTAGQRFGLIRFGSRLDVFLPQQTQIVIQLGQKVHAGKTVIGYLT